MKENPSDPIFPRESPVMLDAMLAVAAKGKRGESAADFVYRGYFPPLFREAESMGSFDPEDLAQRALTRFIQLLSSGRVRFIWNPRPYLLTLLKREFSRWRKSEQQRAASEYLFSRELWRDVNRQHLSFAGFLKRTHRM